MHPRREVPDALLRLAAQQSGLVTLEQTVSPVAPPRLTPECAVLDLANVRLAGETVGPVTRAVQRSLTSRERLERLLQTRTRQRHRDLIQVMLAKVAAGVESYLEMQFLRTVERPHGLPTGRRQDPCPDLPYERDVKYHLCSLLVKLDGRLGHDEDGRFRDSFTLSAGALGSTREARPGDRCRCPAGGAGPAGWAVAADRPCRRDRVHQR